MTTTTNAIATIDAPSIEDRLNKARRLLALVRAVDQQYLCAGTLAAVREAAAMVCDELDAIEREVYPEAFAARG